MAPTTLQGFRAGDRNYQNDEIVPQLLWLKVDNRLEMALKFYMTITYDTVTNFFLHPMEENKDKIFFIYFSGHNWFRDTIFGEFHSLFLAL